jgi:type VI secretion system protein ImpE
MSSSETPTPTLAEQLARAMDDVRKSPQAIGPRMGLFQLACVMGDWRRARTQLDTISKLDPEATILGQVYGRMIDAEASRERVFAGTDKPVALGRPTAWLAMLAQALELDARGEAEAAGDLRGRALGEAAPRGGTIDDRPFAWIMDADPRLGPSLEIIVEGQYRWLPIEHLLELRADPPKAMRDLVWQPATVTLTNGSELAAFIPTRYPGTEKCPEDGLRLARATHWSEAPSGQQTGLGQRLFATDAEDIALLDIRRLRLEPAEASEAALG